MDDCVGGDMFINRGDGVSDYEKLKIAHNKFIAWLRENESMQILHIKTMNRGDDPYSYGHAEGFLLCYKEVIEKLCELVEDKPKPKRGDGMIEVNKPNDIQPNVRCYKCKAEFYVHPMTNMNSEFITNCLLHGGKCEHQSDGTAIALLCNPPIYKMKCKKCGEFYR